MQLLSVSVGRVSTHLFQLVNLPLPPVQGGPFLGNDITPSLQQPGEARAGKQDVAHHHCQFLVSE